LPLQFGAVAQEEQRRLTRARRRAGRSAAPTTSGCGARSTGDEQPREFHGVIRHAGRFNPPQVASLTDAAERTGTTLGALLLGAVCLSLPPHGDGRPFRVGLINARRERPGSERLIALLVELLPVTVTLDSTDPVEAARAVQQQLLAAYDDRGLAHAMPPDSGADAFDVVFNFQPTALRGGGAQRAGELLIRPLDVVARQHVVRARRPWAGGRLSVGFTAADEAIDLWLGCDRDGRSARDADLLAERVPALLEATAGS
jgi:hypothetical protein